MNAAVEVIERVGLRAATIDDITKAAGASRTTFYLYFNDITDIAFELAEGLRPEAFDLFQRLATMQGPSRSDVVRWLRSYIRFSKQRAVLHQCLQEAIIGSAQGADRHLEYLRDFAALMAGQQSPAPSQAMKTRWQLVIMMVDRFIFLNVVEARRNIGSAQLEEMAEVIRISLHPDTWPDEDAR